LRAWPRQFRFGNDDAFVIGVFIPDLRNVNSCIGETTKADCGVLYRTLECGCPRIAKGSRRPFCACCKDSRREPTVVAHLQASLGRQEKPWQRLERVEEREPTAPPSVQCGLVNRVSLAEDDQPWG